MPGTESMRCFVAEEKGGKHKVGHISALNICEGNEAQERKWINCRG